MNKNKHNSLGVLIASGFGAIIGIASVAMTILTLPKILANLHKTSDKKIMKSPLDCCKGILKQEPKKAKKKIIKKTKSKPKKKTNKKKKKKKKK